MSRKPSNYWEKRSTDLILSLEKDTQYTINDLIRIYEQATKNINKEIENLFKNYSKNNTLDKKVLEQLLNKRETDTHYKNLLKVINSNVKDKELKNNLLAKYNAPAYSYRISRLQALQNNIDMEMLKLGDIEQKTTETRYVKTIDEAYNHTIFDIQKGIGTGFTFSQISSDTLKLMLAEKWIDNQNFSQRIWKNTEKLGNYLKINLTADMLTGKSIQKISRDLSSYMNVGLYNATTLVRTEVNHFANESEALGYEECDIEKYQFIATLDNKTCDKCGSLDNKVFNVKDRKVGVNYPPIHPNDRCTTVAYFDDEIAENLTRRARNENNKSIKIPAGMNYNKWKEKYVNKKMTNSNNNDIINDDKIITVENLLDKINVNVNDYKVFGKYDPFDNTIQEQASKLLNMDELPNIVNIEEYKNYKGDEIVRYVHSYHRKTAEEAYKNTLYGKIQYSENTNSSYGRGIYFGEKSRENGIKEYYSHGDNKCINAKIVKEANIIEFENQRAYIREISKRLSIIPNELQKVYEKETSLLFMLDNVDGIKIKSNGYYCIYNRKVLIINE